MSLLLCRFLGIQLTPDTGNQPADEPFLLYLLSIARELRLQMHNTWLFLGAFGALAIAGISWVIAEKWQGGSKWNRQDVIWMAGFTGLLGLSAIAYYIGTHGALARRLPILETIADIFGLGVALAVPVILWFCWRTPNQETEPGDDEKLVSNFRATRTILGLQDYSYAPATPMNPVPEPNEQFADKTADKTSVTAQPVSHHAERLAKTSHAQTKLEEVQTKTEAIVMDNVNTLSIDAQQLTSQPNTPQQGAPASHTLQPAATQPPTQERAASATTFREQLSALNTSWQHIEETGKEVEDWFQRQQRRVLAHLERPTGKGHDNHLELSPDFLERRMDRVDAEWAVIHQTIRDMHRWLENGTSDKDSPQETKVW